MAMSTHALWRCSCQAFEGWNLEDRTLMDVLKMSAGWPSGTLLTLLTLVSLKVVTLLCWWGENIFWQHYCFYGVRMRVPPVCLCVLYSFFSGYPSFRTYLHLEKFCDDFWPEISRRNYCWHCYQLAYDKIGFAIGSFAWSRFSKNLSTTTEVMWGVGIYCI